MSIKKSKTCKAFRSVLKKLSILSRQKTTKNTRELVEKEVLPAYSWRKQVEDTCFMIDNFRLNTDGPSVSELRQQTRLYQCELDYLKRKIAKLQAERSHLTRALETVPCSKPEPVEESTLDITPPQAMTLIESFNDPEPSPVRSRLTTCDSAYFSGGSSPEISPQKSQNQPQKLPKLTFDRETGQCMSNGYNTYYLAV